MADTGLRLMQASALLALCRSFKVPLVINDHLDLCAQIDADGLHLGATDCDLSAARRLLGNDKIICAYCYNQIDLALKAKEAGASYVIFGVSFNSDSALDALEGPLSEFIEAKQKISIPIVVIGNLTLDNAAQVIKAGATSIALMNGLFNAKNIQDTSQQFAQLFTNH
jgi:thiamine-phosphate pyrophosphorylase